MLHGEKVNQFSMDVKADQVANYKKSHLRVWMLKLWSKLETGDFKNTGPVLA